MAMSTITIDFQEAALTATSSQLMIADGNFALDPTSALAMAGTISFTALYVTSEAVNFEVDSGTMFTASITAPVSAPGGAPQIMVSNFVGTVTVTWPTEMGLQTQTLMSGDPITLNGFAN